MAEIKTDINFNGIGRLFLQRNQIVLSLIFTLANGIKKFTTSRYLNFLIFIESNLRDSLFDTCSSTIGFAIIFNSVQSGQSCNWEQRLNILDAEKKKKVWQVNDV